MFVSAYGAEAGNLALNFFLWEAFTWRRHRSAHHREDQGRPLHEGLHRQRRLSQLLVNMPCASSSIAALRCSAQQLTLKPRRGNQRNFPRAASVKF